MRAESPRSYCPISLSLELFGDAWTLLILRDMMFAGKRHFRELLGSDEKIASNVLADRLRLLVAHGIVQKAADPTHKQKAIYSLTERGIELLPVLAQIGIWGRRHLRASDNVDARVKAFNKLLERGGPPFWDKLMAELRATHLPPRRRRSRRER